MNTKVIIYGAGALAILAAVYYFLDYLKLPFEKLNQMAGAAAENYGLQSANAASGPFVLWAKARSDYAKLHGLTGGNVPNWPIYSDWIKGAGFSSFTYGSPNYPEIPSASAFTAISSSF